MAEAASRCPRCGAGFHCGADDPGPCACASVAIEPGMLAELRGRYNGCLCLACLRALSQPLGPEQPGPSG